MARAQGSLKKGHITPKPDPDPQKTVLKEGWENSRIIQTSLEDFLEGCFLGLWTRESKTSQPCLHTLI